MATIRKYRGKFNVQIRKKGYPFISKSFVSLTVAKKWAATTEADMERRLHVVIPDDTTVGELLNRYDREVLPSHKGQQAEKYRLGNLKRHFGGMRLADLTSKEVTKYRDMRLKQVSPASLKRELTIFSQALSTASKDWGISLPQNPVQMISLPKADKARTRRLEVGEQKNFSILQIRNSTGSSSLHRRLLCVEVRFLTSKRVTLISKSGCFSYRLQRLIHPEPSHFQLML